MIAVSPCGDSPLTFLISARQAGAVNYKPMEIVILAIAYPVAIALLFYFAFLRPVQQQQRRHRQELANLQVGDEVLTQAGFIATVKDIIVPAEGPSEILLDLGNGLEVRAFASAIVQRLQPAATSAHQEADASRVDTGRAKG